MKRRRRLSCCITSILMLVPLMVTGHSISEYEQQKTAIEQRTPSLAPEEIRCNRSLESKKIAAVIGEIHHNQWTGKTGYFDYFTTPEDPAWVRRFGTRRPVYGDLAKELNRELSKLGLQTYTAEQITGQIPRDNLEALFENDLEAAGNGATYLTADFILRGLISTRTQVNSTVNVDELFVTIDLVLLDRNGGVLSTTQISKTAFSDADIQAVLKKMMHKDAENIVRILFKNYCKDSN